jgi:hypothetical protein
MNFRKLLTILAAATIGLSGVAYANPIIRLSSGGTTATVADGDGNDSCATAGCVTYSGPLNDWIVNVTTGIGTPPLGPNPHLDLNSVNVSNAGTGFGTSILLELTQMGFTDGIGGIAGFLGEIGGTLGAGGKIEWWVYVDNTNTAFGTGTLVASGSATTSPFTGIDSGSLLLTGPYSMTLAVRITHPDGTRSTSFDFSGQLIPEPGTLFLLGAGLLGVALVRRKLS